jgi:serine/threonine-protein kinase
MSALSKAMDDTAWKHAKQVFYEALEETGPERVRVVTASCGDDVELRAQVEALLTAHDEAGDFLSEVTLAPPVAGSSAPVAHDPDARFAALQATVAGRYSLERELGRGGMGVVYLARDVSLDRPVAIKLLSEELGGRREARERFLREARTSARLSHPNIVPVHAVEEHGDLVFFVMGFIDGETVSERVQRRGPMSVGDVVRLLQEIAWALGHAHVQGVVHRDVKPDNVILEIESGRAVVTDFGIAWTEAPTGLTSAGSLLGTPEYVSPEQGLGNDVDGRSDLYSLGVTCFFALTGRLPFESNSVKGLLTKHLNEPAPSVTVYRPDVPGKLASALDRCLAKAPEDRFETAEALADAVSEARAQVVEIPQAIRAVRSAAELMVVDGAGFVALAGVLGFMVLPPDRTPDYFSLWEYSAYMMQAAALTLAAGFIGGRAVQVITRSREAVVQGFGASHLRSSFLAQPVAAAGEVVGTRGRRLPAGLEASALAAALVLSALFWVVYTWHADRLIRVVGAGLPILLVTIPFAAIPVLVGRVAGARVIRRWPVTRRWWACLWQGRMSTWVFTVAGMGFGTTRQPVASPRPTEALVAAAAASLFDSLPAVYQTRLNELPDLVVRLEAAAEALRVRDGELAGALAAVGPVAATVDRGRRVDAASMETGEYVSVQEHRARVVNDIDAARRQMAKRLAATMAALENLRLGLLRLQAGVGTPDELTADLRAADEIGREVQALLEGERQVEGVLGEGRPGADRVRAGEDPSPQESP